MVRLALSLHRELHCLPSLFFRGSIDDLILCNRMVRLYIWLAGILPSSSSMAPCARLVLLFLQEAIREKISLLLLREMSRWLWRCVLYNISHSVRTAFMYSQIRRSNVQVLRAQGTYLPLNRWQECHDDVQYEPHSVKWSSYWFQLALFLLQVPEKFSMMEDTWVLVLVLPYHLLNLSLEMTLDFSMEFSLAFRTISWFCQRKRERVSFNQQTALLLYLR